MSEETTNKTLIHIAETEDGNIEMHIAGKGGDLVQVLASVIDDDSNFQQMVELALMMVKMKNQEFDPAEFDQAVDETGFMNPPQAEA